MRNCRLNPPPPISLPPPPVSDTRSPSCVFFFLQGLLILLIVLAVVIRRRLVKKHEMARGELHERLLNQDNELLALSRVWEIQASELSLGPSIGHGTFGDVYCGTWQELTVAIKVLKISLHALDDSFGAEFEAEANKLRTLRHPNLVFFFG